MEQSDKSNDYFIRKLSIKSKILFLIVFINLLSTTIFIYSSYEDMKNIIVEPINKHLESTTVVSNNILGEYHNKIQNKTKLTDTEKKEYIDVGNKLKKIAIDLQVDYIYSFILVQNNNQDDVVYCSTNDEEEYYKKYSNATPKLLSLLKGNSMKLEYEQTIEPEIGEVHTVFVPYKNKDGVKYVIGVDIKIEYINDLLKEMREKFIKIGAILFIISIVVSVILLNIFLNQIPIIKDGLIQFFKYLNKETERVESIRISSNDELGEMASVINKNILITQENIVKDNVLINNIKDVSKLIANGSFQHRIEVDAHSPTLNEAKDVINGMLNNIQDVVFKVVKIIGEYSRNNYIVVLDNESYKDEFLELIESINTLGANISKEKLQNAHDSISIQKSSNYLRQFIEDIIFLFTNISKDVEHLSKQLVTNEKFNLKLQNKISEILEEKNYLENIVTEFKNDKNVNSTETDELLKDMEYSLYKFEQTLGNINKEIGHEILDIQQIREPLDLLNETIKENRTKSENTIKVASDLSSVSSGIRETIENSDFIGKDNINIMMQYVDR